MKIKTYAGGGIAYLPTTNAVEATSGASTTSSSSSTSKVPGFTDKIIDMVTANGIDNDVTAFLRKVQNTLDLANDPTGQNLSMKEILSLARQANLVKRNFDDYGKARENLESQDAWADVALDSRGNIYVYDSSTKGIKPVSVDTYIANRDSYLALTYEELLQQRRSNANLAYDHSILDNVSNGVGVASITKYLKDMIDAFESTEVTGVAKKNASKIQAGLTAIVNGRLADGNTVSGAIEAGPDGLYKISQKSTIADTHLTEAASYLYSSLPTNYRRALEARAAVEGYDPSALIVTMLQANTGRIIDATYDSTLNKATGGSGSSEGMNQHTYAESLADGSNLAPPTYMEITPAGSTSHLFAYGQNAGPLSKATSSNEIGTPLGACSVAQALEDAYALRDVTQNKTVAFGDQLISKDQLGGIMYTGSDVYRVVLPAKNVNGDIVPDFDLQKKIDAAVKQAQDSGADATTINQVLQQVCPGAKYNAETGGITLPSNRTHVFLGFQGVAANNFIDFEANDEYFVKSNANVQAYKAAAEYGYANYDKNDRPRNEGSASNGGFFGGSWWTSTKNHLYEGMVYLPISNKMAGTMKYNQEYIPKSSYTNITSRAMESERQAEMRERLSNSDNLNWGS